jgi:hypothetical protein
MSDIPVDRELPRFSHTRMYRRRIYTTQTTETHHRSPDRRRRETYQNGNQSRSKRKTRCQHIMSRTSPIFQHQDTPGVRRGARSPPRAAAVCWCVDAMRGGVVGTARARSELGSRPARRADRRAGGAGPRHAPRRRALARGTAGNIYARIAPRAAT